MKLLCKLLLSFLIAFSLGINAQPKTYFVATDGNDSNAGTKDQPYLTITKAISIAVAGDTIFVRGGTYSLTAKISIGSKTGASSSNRCYLWAYPDERPLLDFSSITGTSTDGLSLSGNYWYIKGFSIKGAPHNGLKFSGGSYNIVEYRSSFENRNSGMQLDNGASNNKIINCDSYYNFDAQKQGADADGFAPKLTVGTGNYFYGCRSWTNSDDGWDGYMRGATGVTTTLENCWTFGNGYTKDGTDPGSQANGNGFKMGGGDNSNNLHLMHHFILKNCLSFYNKAKGFDQNNNDGSMTLLNCTGFGNKTANFRITRQVNAGQTVIVKNSVTLNGSAELGSFAIQSNNGWLSPFVVTAEDFVSIDTTGISGPRKPDGSLPDVDFMHLVSTSSLIDAGVDVGIPYAGIAPDLGAFEFGLAMYPAGVKLIPGIPSAFRLEQNYPNPFNPVTNIVYTILKETKVTLEVFDILGRRVTTLVNTNQQAGKYVVDFDASRLSSGMYIYRLSTPSVSFAKKMLLMK